MPVRSRMFSSVVFTTALFVVGVPSSAEEPIPLPEELFETHVVRAVEEICLDWVPKDDWIIKFEGKKPGYLGTAYLLKKKVVIWIQSRDTPKSIASTYVHELAHVFAHLYVTEKLRAEWLKIRGLPADTQWFSPTGGNDFAYGSGDFAESVSWTFQKFDFSSNLGPPPNQKQQELIRDWFLYLPLMAGE